MITNNIVNEIEDKMEIIENAIARNNECFLAHIVTIF